MISRIGEGWQQLANKFNALSKRERLILLLAILALIYLVWSLTLLNPVSSRIEALNAQLASVETRLTDLRAQEEVFSLAAGQDPLAGKKRQIERLQQQLAQLDGQLQSLAVGLVPADNLPQVLHDVLDGTGTLELLGMQTLPVEKVAISEGEATLSGDSGGPGQVNVFRHAVELKVRGSYFAVADYLQALEELDWRFYWGKLNYAVDGYPNAVATLQVYTLSAGEGPLGE